MTRRARGDRGSLIVLMAASIFASIVLMGLVIDIGRVAVNARANQSVADLAALAAGADLADGNYAAACHDAIGYLNVNAPDLVAIDADAFCAQTGNDVTATKCNGKELDQARPSVTNGKYSVSIHFPVPDSEIRDAGYGAGNNDGTECFRMRVIVSTTEPTFFAGAVGVKTVTATRSATIKASDEQGRVIPALWVLDPTGCTALALSGNNTQAVVGTTDVPGIVQVESNGTTCSQNQHTVSVTGSGALLKAIPTSGDNQGQVGLHALASGAVVCSGTACDPADVSGGRIQPQPTSARSRGRAPIDWRWNCKSSYPIYHGIAVEPCPTAASTGPYIDNLRNAVGTAGPPSATYQRWSTNHSCNPSGNVTVSGNWLVDCPSDLQIGNGTSVTFASGNVVLDAGVSMTGGSLSFNTNNSGTLPTNCMPPLVWTPCIDSSSAGAAFVYSRSGNFNLTGGTLNMNHAVLYQASGYVKIASSNPPTWLGPTEGPFNALAMWSELSSNKYQINGGANVHLSGAFFAPEAAPISLAGGGNWGQQSAQFIAFHIMLSGSSVVTMVPNLNGVSIPPSAGQLIR